jgi:hypothetical protein
MIKGELQMRPDFLNQEIKTIIEEPISFEII